MTDATADPRDRLLAAAIGAVEPRTIRELTRDSGVAPGAVEGHLRDLLDEGDVLALDGDGQRRYASDPVRAYVEGLAALADVPVEEETIRESREALAGWTDAGSVSTVEDFRRYRGVARLAAASRTRIGFHPYEADWDVLVVLDTCRVDALRSVADRLDGLSRTDVQSRVSPGSQTAEWLCGTFTADRAAAVARTGYVSGNGWVKGVFGDGLRPDDDVWFDGTSLPTSWDVVDGEQFGAMVHAWQHARGEYTTDVPWAPHPEPRTVTDHAVALAREREDLDRLVVHYKQPHAPYTVAARREGRDQLAPFERAPFDYLAGGGAWGRVWEAYATDLRAAVEEVNALCRNVDGRVAVTADHGEAFGERDDYGHRPTMLHPTVRRVPWATLDATDERTREVDRSAYRRTDRDVDDQLAALGYR